MSGELRLHRTEVEQDGPVLLSMFGFVALVVLTKWLFPLSGWTPIAIFGQ